MSSGLSGTCYRPHFSAAAAFCVPASARRRPAVIWNQRFFRSGRGVGGAHWALPPAGSAGFVLLEMNHADDAVPDAGGALVGPDGFPSAHRSSAPRRLACLVL